MAPAHAPREVLLCETQGGPMLVFAADSIIGRSLVTAGHFGEQKIDEVLEALRRHNLTPRCFVDIGANIGTHTLHALDSGRFERAIAIEADEGNFLLLKANVAMRGHSERATLLHCALSDRVGIVELELSPSNFGDHRVRVSGVVQQRDLGESSRATLEVRASTADKVFGDRPMDWDAALVWMDTQGHEGHILAGGRGSLALAASAVVMEFWPYGLQRSGGKASYFEFLARMSVVYDINRADWCDRGRVSVSDLLELYERMLSDTRADHYPHTDLLCIRSASSTPDIATCGLNGPPLMNTLQRSLMTISCRDSDAIPKVPGAGSVVQRGPDRHQVMHNGIEVVYGGYHGEWMAHVIRGLNGHHEPQEELIFHTLLRYVRDGTRIVELGSFWAYYTQWFLKAIPGSVAVCIEPDRQNMEVGRRNTALNGNSERVRFVDGWIGGEACVSFAATTENSTQPRTLPMFDSRSLLDLIEASAIELLHMDIQGAELPFLLSIDAAMARDRLRFIMVSTHHSSISGSPTTHSDCVEALRALGATILVEHDVIESFSGDGLILASVLPGDRDLWFPPISRNRAETSLFSRA